MVETRDQLKALMDSFKEDEENLHKTIEKDFAEFTKVANSLNVLYILVHGS